MRRATCDHCQHSAERSKGSRPRINGARRFYCDRVECQLAARADKLRAELGSPLFTKFVEHLCGQPAEAGAA